MVLFWLVGGWGDRKVGVFESRFSEDRGEEAGMLGNRSLCG